MSLIKTNAIDIIIDEPRPVEVDTENNEYPVTQSDSVNVNEPPIVIGTDDGTLHNNNSVNIENDKGCVTLYPNPLNKNLVIRSPKQ